MIRAVDYNPSLKMREEPLGLPEQELEWMRSLRYFESYGSSFSTVAAGCKVVGKVPYLEVIDPLAAQLMGALVPLRRVAKVAGMYFSSQEWLTGDSKKDMSLFQSALNGVGKGLEVVEWVAEIEALAVSSRIMYSLSGMGMAVSIVSSMMALIGQLKEEEWEMTELFKTSYNAGLSLLGIYLFATAITLSNGVSLLLAGASFGISYL